jgi:hypothetical protein
MSQRIQNVVPAVPAVLGRPGSSSTTAFVNVYRERGSDKIYIGSKTFRTRRNAERKGAANVGGVYVKTQEILAAISL